MPHPSHDTLTQSAQARSAQEQSAQTQDARTADVPGPDTARPDTRGPDTAVPADRARSLHRGRAFRLVRAIAAVITRAPGRDAGSAGARGARTPGIRTSGARRTRATRAGRRPGGRAVVDHRDGEEAHRIWRAAVVGGGPGLR